MNIIRDIWTDLYNYLDFIFHSSWIADLLGRFIIVTGVFSTIIGIIAVSHWQYRQNSRNRDSLNMWLWDTGRGGIIILLLGIICYHVGVSLDMSIVDSIAIEIIGAAILVYVLIQIDRGADQYYNKLGKKRERNRGLYRKRKPSIKRNLHRSHKLKSRRKRS